MPSTPVGYAIGWCRVCGDAPPDTLPSRTEYAQIMQPLRQPPLSHLSKASPGCSSRYHCISS